jgi:hypothetical protein
LISSAPNTNQAPSLNLPPQTIAAGHDTNGIHTLAGRCEAILLEKDLLNTTSTAAHIPPSSNKRSAAKR